MAHVRHCVVTASVRALSLSVRRGKVSDTRKRRGGKRRARTDALACTVFFLLRPRGSSKDALHTSKEDDQSLLAKSAWQLGGCLPFSTAASAKCVGNDTRSLLNHLRRVSHSCSTSRSVFTLCVEEAAVVRLCWRGFSGLEVSGHAALGCGGARRARRCSISHSE